MKATLTHPSWAQIEKGCAKIALQLVKSNYKPDYIVGLSRGGLIPAVIISHILDIPLIPISYSSLEGNGDDKRNENILPTILGSGWSGMGKLPLPPNLFLIDEICDSGNTLYEVFEHYAKQGHSIRTATLYVKQLSLDNQLIIPDFYWQKIDNTSPWIEFPWES